MKNIGILGGMGPEASAYAYKYIIAEVQNQFRPGSESDYPPIVIYNLPLKGLDDTGIKDGDGIASQLIEGVHLLENAGCDFVIIPCNSVHVCYDEVVASCTVPILHIVDEVRKEINKRNYSRVGLLATETTNTSGLYDTYLENISLRKLNSKDQQILNSIIGRVSRGEKNDSDFEVIKYFVDCFVNASAEAVILGCTELGLLVDMLPVSISIIDSNHVLAKSAVQKAYDV